MSKFSFSVRQRIKLPFDSDLVFLIATVFLLGFEVFSGALRYYFSHVGLAWVVYIPKVACCLLSVFYLVKERSSRKFWAFLLWVLVSAAVALYNGATIKNVMLVFFFLTPLFFVMMAGDFVLRNRALLWRIFLALFAVSVIGLILDKAIYLPWKGHTYLLNSVELAANKQWTQLGEDRPSGFSRDSANLGIMISIFSLFALSLHKKKIIWAVLVVSLFLVSVTTYKSAMPAYVLSIMVFMLPRRFSSKFSCSLIVVGIFLPACSAIFSFSYNKDYYLLNSLVDRMANTWPHFYSQVVDHGTFLLGLGFGAVGSTTAIFPIPGLNVVVADNTLLYLFGMFGLLGVFIYVYQLNTIRIVARLDDGFSRPLMPICVFLIVISWTTDLTESAIAMFYIGLMISLAKKTNRRNSSGRLLNSAFDSNGGRASRFSIG